MGSTTLLVKTAGDGGKSIDGTRPGNRQRSGWPEGGFIEAGGNRHILAGVSFDTGKKSQPPPAAPSDLRDTNEPTVEGVIAIKKGIHTNAFGRA